jgi:hypothetical protein
MILHRPWTLAAAFAALAAGCATRPPPRNWHIGLDPCLVDPYHPPCFDPREQSIELSVSPRDVDLQADGIADPNTRPIFLRAVGDRTSVSVLYVVGHAEHACCREVSALVQEAAALQPLADDWLSYGVARLAGASARSRSDLAAIVRRAEQIAAGSACAGQLDVAYLAEDPAGARASELLAVSRDSVAAARREERPVLVWNELPPGDFVFAPMLVADPDGELSPLTIELPRSEFDYPAQVLDEAAVIGLDAYIAELRRSVVRARVLAAMARTPRVVTKIAWKRVEGPPDRISPDMVDAVEAVNRQLESALAETRELLAVHLPPLTPGSAASWAEQRKFTEVVARKLQRMLDDNRAFVRATHPGTRSKSTFTFHIDVRVEREQSDFLGALREEAIDALPGLEAQLQDALRMRRRPPGDTLPALVDASLRGWPATMRTDAAEKAFDDWQLEHQRGLWDEVLRVLRAQGVIPSKESDPMRRFRASNLLFRVERRGASVLVRPVYVLAGGFYIVADPGTRLVRFEAATTDQNRMK